MKLEAVTKSWTTVDDHQQSWGQGEVARPPNWTSTTSETASKPVGFSWWLGMICRREEGEKKGKGGGGLMGKRERKGKDL